ncbi:SubName: Full=Uncharacterized protein {ECO:0000313/EMBL:CCA70028.1} [Serendipita indica DSM 11827]|nr:SubName: Full=Uncharacterized protein {ECO:0000313/EMBL:CCA70028.1} [Serendipita indica DSM 11827]
MATQDAQPIARTKKTSSISLAPVNKNNVGTLRKLLRVSISALTSYRLTSVILPVIYTDRFFTEVLLPETEEYCQLVYYNDIPVGTVCSRIETDESHKEAKLYIMTMGVLAPYRSLGLGTHALKHVLNAASTSTAKPYIKAIYLHVQINNEAAKRFYERNGFKEVGVVENYYKKIEPRAAWVMEWTAPPRPAEAEKTEKSDEKQPAKAQGKGGKKRR